MPITVHLKPLRVWLLGRWSMWNYWAKTTFSTEERIIFSSTFCQNPREQRFILFQKWLSILHSLSTWFAFLSVPFCSFTSCPNYFLMNTLHLFSAFHLKIFTNTSERKYIKSSSIKCFIRSPWHSAHKQKSDGLYSKYRLYFLFNLFHKHSPFHQTPFSFSLFSFLNNVLTSHDFLPSVTSFALQSLTI